MFNNLITCRTESIFFIDRTGYLYALCIFKCCFGVLKTDWSAVSQLVSISKKMLRLERGLITCFV